MNKVFGILLVGLVVPFLSGINIAWAEQRFKDNDWTHPSFERCADKGGFANGSEVSWQTEANKRFLRFSLKDGQKGNCSRDKISRSRAPYWERSEVTIGPTKGSRFQMRSGKQYSIEINMRFVEGFSSDRESILQIYTKCPGGGRCTPPLMLRSDGYSPNPSRLTVYTAHKSSSARIKQSWSLAAKMNDYKQQRTPFASNTDEVFAPNLHLGKWVKLNLVVKVQPKKIFVQGNISDGSKKWAVEFIGIDRVPGTEEPHLEVGIYRPGSYGMPNPTSTIDFDYIKISKISAADYVEVLNEFQKIRTKKESALEAKFGKYSDADICAAVKKFGEFKQGRDWVNESHRRKLPCND